MCNMTSESDNLNNLDENSVQITTITDLLLCEGNWLVTIINSPSENILGAWVNHSHKYDKLHLYHLYFTFWICHKTGFEVHILHNRLVTRVCFCMSVKLCRNSLFLKTNWWSPCLHLASPSTVNINAAFPIIFWSWNHF
jgi:hypothetical protein